MGGGGQLRRATNPEMTSQNELAAARSSKNARKLRVDAGKPPPPSPTPGSSAISFYYSYFKGTVSIISSDPPCKDDNVRFTTVPLKPLEDIVVFLGFRVLSSDNSSKSCCHLDITLTVPLMIL